MEPQSCQMAYWRMLRSSHWHGRASILNHLSAVNHPRFSVFWKNNWQFMTANASAADYSCYMKYYSESLRFFQRKPKSLLLCGPEAPRADLRRGSSLGAGERWVQRPPKGCWDHTARSWAVRKSKEGLRDMGKREAGCGRHLPGPGLIYNFESLRSYTGR